MSKRAQPAITIDEVSFELERFERDGDQLRLTGRWFGIRGRRFVRPTLTPLGGHELSRVLADLEHKPWAAEDGGRWEAAFPWDQDGELVRFELSVAPDIAIALPTPGGKLSRSRRLSALPRRPSVTAASRPPKEDPVPEPRPSPPTEVEPQHDEPDASAIELGAVRAQLDATTAELKAAHRELANREVELDGVKAELEVARGELRAVVTARDAAAGDAAEVVTSRDQIQGERDELAAELMATQQTVVELRSALEQSNLGLEQAAREREQADRERDEAVAAHGAALVMRRATRAAPYHEHRSRSWRPVLAILVLLAVVFAILIVVHVL